MERPTTLEQLIEYAIKRANGIASSCPRSSWELEEDTGASVRSNVGELAAELQRYLDDIRK